ncbi:MAG: transcription termination factor NusA [Candidatus Omnitrophica bacterium]|nr:transcription termination factor NusA [Candidatus Omnitrophota bacterium]MCM8802030.1 transcription termination factor NusA [Candidatus Omnitrophota bacterium]
MKKEIISLLEYWEKERGIERNHLIESLEDGLLMVYRKKAQLPKHIKIKINPETGDIRFIDENGKEIQPPSFPWERIAAQTARHILIQKIKEAEKNTIYNEFKDLEGSIVSGRVERFENENVIIVTGKAEGILPHHHKLPNDHFKVGDAIRCYLLEVRPPSKGFYQLIFSRTHPNFVKKLLESEIPEIKEEIVEIKAIARFPGDLTKVAVFSKDEKIDPVGTCIGDRASRIKNVVKELRGEKIEVILWDKDITKFIKNSLSPAKSNEVYIDEVKKEAIVIVEDDQLFLAIGKKGQNVRLASKLTGWNIKVFKVSEYKKGAN